MSVLEKVKKEISRLEKETYAIEIQLNVLSKVASWIIEDQRGANPPVTTPEEPTRYMGNKYGNAVYDALKENPLTWFAPNDLVRAIFYQVKPDDKCTLIPKTDLPYGLEFRDRGSLSQALYALRGYCTDIPNWKAIPHWLDVRRVKSTGYNKSGWEYKWRGSELPLEKKAESEKA